jgi:hypothetical protein
MALTFISIPTPECPKDGAGIFTTNGNGIQYPQPGWGGEGGCNLITRWQGPGAVDSFVRRDLSRFTALPEQEKPPPSSGWMRRSYQRGPRQSGEYEPSGVQFYGDSGGMFIDTLAFPNNFVVGGGFNDWFVRTWPGKGNVEAPKAFYYTDSNGVERENDLAVQGMAGVGFFHTEHVNLKTRKPGGQVSLMLSLTVASRPDLTPIVLVAALFDSFPDAIRPNPDGFVGCDFGPADDPTGKGGVWFTGTYLTPENVDPYSDVVYTGSYTQKLMPKDDRHAQAEFFRIHYTPEHIRKLISKINSMDVGSACPKNGYPTDLHDYRLHTIGIITEVLTFEESKEGGSLGDITKNSMAIGMHFDMPEVYRVVPE